MAVNKNPQIAGDKKQQLLTTAFALFYQRGVHQVGINEVLTTAAVAKKKTVSPFSRQTAVTVGGVRTAGNNLASLDG